MSALRVALAENARSTAVSAGCHSGDARSGRRWGADLFVELSGVMATLRDFSTILVTLLMHRFLAGGLVVRPEFPPKWR